MVGDSVKDLEAGHRAGTTNVLVLTGYGQGELTHQAQGWPIKPDHVADDLLAAVTWILEREATL
jgi:D-glycero-D-manno-heptose 1,7-bisphosphate phosphatase